MAFFVFVFVFVGEHARKRSAPTPRVLVQVDSAVTDVIGTQYTDCVFSFENGLFGNVGKWITF